MDSAFKALTLHLVYLPLVSMFVVVTSCKTLTWLTQLSIPQIEIMFSYLSMFTRFND